MIYTKHKVFCKNEHVPLIKNKKMEYADQVYTFLLKLRPGERVNVNSSKDPARFIETVKDMMDNWNLKDFEFNADYSVLRRMNGFNLNKHL